MGTTDTKLLADPVAHEPELLLPCKKATRGQKQVVITNHLGVLWKPLLSQETNFPSQPHTWNSLRRAFLASTRSEGGCRLKQLSSCASVVCVRTHGSAEQMPCIYGSHILFLRLINYTLGGVIASLEPMLLGRKGCHHLQHPCEQTLNWSCQNVPLVTTGAKLSWHKLDRTSVFYRKGAGPMLLSHVRPVT